MIDFKINVPNIEEITAAYLEAPDIVRPILQKAIVNSQIVIDKYKTQDIPRRTGMLQMNWDFQVGDLIALYQPLQYYAPYVQFGTGIYGPVGHRIVPKVKRALADQKNGWGPYTSTAGMKANPFMDRLVADAQGDVTALFAEALDLINEAMAEQSNA